LRGDASPCGLGADLRCYKTLLSLGEELELIPSQMVYLAGCNLRCSFCIQAPASQDPHAGEPCPPADLAGQLLTAVAHGARTVNVLGGEPGIQPVGLLELVAAAAPRRLPLVLNTNLYLTPAALGLLLPVVELLLVDFKFGAARCASRLAGTPDYLETLTANLRRVRGSPLIIRHLVLPGHLDCCLAPVARWVARHLPGARFSLQFGYLPPSGLRGDPELGRPLDRETGAAARRLVEGLGLRLTGLPSPSPRWAAPGAGAEAAR